MGLKLFTINIGNHKVKVLSYPTDMLNILLEYDGLKNKRWAQSVHTLTVLNLEKQSNLGLIYSNRDPDQIQYCSNVRYVFVDLCLVEAGS